MPISEKDIKAARERVEKDRIVAVVMDGDASGLQAGQTLHVSEALHGNVHTWLKLVPYRPTGEQ